MKKTILSELNIIRQCREEFNVPLWRCPLFLFILMGFMVIVSVLVSYFVGNYYSDQPEIIALLTLFVAGVIFILGHIIVRGVAKTLEINKEKANFFKMVTHQLLTPLTALKWSLSALTSDQINNNSQKQAEIFDIIRENNEKMVRSVNMLLEISRIEGGRIVMNLEKFDLLAYVRNAILWKNEDLKKKKNTITLHSDEHLPMVLADGSRIKIVVDSLLDNAISYSKEHTAIEVSLLRKQDNVIFEVRDVGVGIPQQVHKDIFDKFFRAKNAKHHKIRGLGIGLFLSKRIIEASGGKIDFKSQEDIGSTFWFSLPIYKEHVQ